MSNFKPQLLCYYTIKRKVPILKFISELSGSLPDIIPGADSDGQPPCTQLFFWYYVIDHCPLCSWLNCNCEPHHSSSLLFCSVFRVDTADMISDTIHPDTSPLVCKPVLVRPAFARPRTGEVFGDGWQQWIQQRKHLHANNSICLLPTQAWDAKTRKLLHVRKHQTICINKCESTHTCTHSRGNEMMYESS